MPEKTAKPTTKPGTRRVRVPRSTPRRPMRRAPNQGQIAERAYFIALERDDDDQLEHWLRAERELTGV